LVYRVDVFNCICAGDDTNALQMDGVELSISPLLWLAWASLGLRQDRGYFGLRGQFF